MNHLPGIWTYLALVVPGIVWFFVFQAPAYAQDNDSLNRFTSSYHVDVINPTPQNNTKGAKSPGYRGVNQLVVYTSSFGNTTGTSGSGIEAVINNGKIVKFNSSNSLIPDNGFIVSGNGHAGQWIKRILRRGAEVSLNHENSEIVVKTTPYVYIFELEEMLEKSKKNGNSNDPRYKLFLSQGESCLDSLRSRADEEITESLVSLANKCREFSTKAFYKSVTSIADEFRGIWVRPMEKTADEIRRTIEELKELRIKHIFLETYYEGRTLYPSQVMADYGLPVQHNRFQGWDPLKVWIETAQEHGIKVHAWVQVFYAGNQKSTLEAYGPILQKYPEWRNVQKTAIKQSVPVPSVIEEGHYFLDPANPEVKTFLEKLFLETVTRYPVDGLNLDYIRYPSSRPYNHPDYVASTWGYTPVARKAFEEFIIAAEQKALAEAKQKNALKTSGKKSSPARLSKSIKKSTKAVSDPAELDDKSALWPRWISWRKEQVSDFVRSISVKARDVNKNLFITAVIFPETGFSNHVKLQDWQRWADEKLIHAITPIGLGADSNDIYLKSSALKKEAEGKIAIYAGIFGMYNRQGPIELLAQIESVHRTGLPGIILFERSRLEEDYSEALVEGAFRE